MKERIFLWGTGGAANFIMNMMGDIITAEYNILGFIDNSQNCWGKLFRNIPVYTPDYLFDKEFDRIVILINEQASEVRTQIEDMLGNEVTVSNKYYFMKKIIERKYNCSDNTEIRNILDYLKNNDLDVFNYDYVKEYDDIQITPLYDAENGMYYVMHAGKKLYFSRKYDSADRVKDYYRSLLIEQDSRSPHKYTDDEFCVEPDSVVVDAGVAEANFSLEIIDRVKRIYMFEADECWIEAIKLTFAEYMDKIVIINKFLSDEISENTITLDAAIDERIDFIKMDIEGYETKALQGAARVLGNKDIRIAVCAYHRDEDEYLITSYLGKIGFECVPASGYMWYPYGEAYSDKLRRGVLRCVRIH